MGAWGQSAVTKTAAIGMLLIAAATNQKNDGQFQPGFCSITAPVLESIAFCGIGKRIHLVIFGRLEVKHPGHADDWSAMPMACSLMLLMPS